MHDSELSLRKEEITLQSVVIIGAGMGGLSILKILLDSKDYQVIGVVDRYQDAAGLQLAKKRQIKTGSDWIGFLDGNPDIVIEVTGNEQVYQEIARYKKNKTLLVHGQIAFLLANLIQEKEILIKKSKEEAYLHELVLNATDNGMVLINPEERIIFYNQAAATITGVARERAIGQHIHKVIPASRLPNILISGKTESNQRAHLEKDLDIITTRMPIFNEKGDLLGALAVFKGITEFTSLAEEITNLKHIQNMLEAIIHSSEDAITVVDEDGKGILINPAYTRITGLTKEDVLGKPATADIAEGKSMHMQVLRTKKPVRGVRMKVGSSNRDVVVNVAPIMVNGDLRGSVGVIHDLSEIQSLTKELKRARQIIRNLEAKYTFDDIIGQSKEMRWAMEQARLCARTPVTVLLRGESGTGKELFAHAIHNASDRKYNTFIRVNCAAISESLLESELFGYEEGAFSGAKRGGKRGLFEEANNGSIFLDEIGELSQNMQAKLLRVLQENEIVRVGGTKPVSINVRVITATNVNLEKAIANGTFREDLYYRINRMPIFIEPLKERKEDIPPLCAHLIKKLNLEYGRNIEDISGEALIMLQEYDWTGNVRELENILGRAIIFMEVHEKIIQKRHFPEKLLKTNEIVSTNIMENRLPLNEKQSLAEQLQEVEKRIIRSTLDKHNGNKTAASRDLGLSIRNFYYKLQKFELV